MFKIKKKSKAAKKHSSTKGLTVSENGHVQFDEVVLMRQHLKGPGKLIGDNELSKMIKLNKSAEYINKRMRKRFIAALLGFGVVALFTFTSKKPTGTYLFVGLALALLIWVVDMHSTNTFYTNYQIRRSIAWSSFVRMAAAYLADLSSGSNMYSVFKKIVPRLNNQKDRDNLDRLMIQMSEDAHNAQPFLDFAHTYSSSQEAEMIMLIIQDMYLGNVSDENIMLLANNATRELSEQMDVIMQHKLDRFKTLFIQFSIVGMIAPIVVGIMMAGSMIGSMLAGMV